MAPDYLLSSSNTRTCKSTKTVTEAMI